MEGDTITRKDVEKLLQKLDENFALSQENNRMLLNMRKWGRVAFWFKVAIWTVVLIAPILLLPYFAPFLSQIPGLSGITQTSTSTSSSLFGLPSPAAVVEFLHPMK